MARGAAADQTQAGGTYLDPQTLATIGSVELRARMVIEGVMTGKHRSPYHGVSTEFAQHRPYAPGDDMRFLDWKVFGRTDKLYVKQYQQETNLDMLVMVDASGSMAYDSGHLGRQAWRKFDHAATIAAAVTFLAIRQRDRAALTLFARSVDRATRMSNRSDHWRTIAEALESAEPLVRTSTEDDGAPDADDERTDLERLFDTVTARLSRRSLLVLVSDLFDDTASFERGLAKLYHRGHDLMVLQVLDPAEREFPFRAPSRFTGLEAEGLLDIEPAALRTGYLDALREHLEQVEQISRKFGFDYALVDSGLTVGPVLSQFLARRAMSIARR